MPNPYFQFKQFTIYQKNAAMKVGTDGVLLGAWADCTNCNRILDIGTGTGLIALMLAQRSTASIDAVELDKNACKDAATNFANSPWHHRITLHETTIQDFVSKSNHKFDLIVCNPPFFANSLKTPDSSRNMARHNDALPINDLFFCVKNLLEKHGRFEVIIPFELFDDYKQTAQIAGLYTLRLTMIKPTPQTKIKRVLLSFGSDKEITPITDELIIELNGRHKYSSQYIALTREYYLKFP